MGLPFLVLTFGNAHRHAIHFIGNFDLAGKAAIVTNINSEIEHIFFHATGLSRFVTPFLIDIDVTGGA
jgi:hypothetical protein